MQLQLPEPFTITNLLFSTPIGISILVTSCDEFELGGQEAGRFEQHVSRQSIELRLCSYVVWLILAG